MSERSVSRLGNVSVEHHDWCHREFSEDEHSEDIALLVLQISEITSFTSTTQLRNTPPEEMQTRIVAIDVCGGDDKISLSRKASTPVALP